MRLLSEVMENKARLWGRESEVDVKLMIEMELCGEVMYVEVELRHEMKVWCGVKNVWGDMRLLSEVKIGSKKVSLLGKEA